jgi:hypothetical protein
MAPSRYRCGIRERRTGIDLKLARPTTQFWWN